MNRRVATLGCGIVLLALLAQNAAAAPNRARKKQEPKAQNAISFEFEYHDFGNSHDPWSLATVEYSHRFGFGSVIGRVNRAHRFGQSGRQIEVDAYPRLGRGMYLYTNVGFSADRVFPRQRFGAELYKSLPNSYEASAGFRQLNFGSNVTLFTGSIAKYRGNYYYVARPYISNRTDGISVSGQLMLRTYFATADDHASLTATFGSSPTEDIAPDAVDRRQSWSVRAGAQRALRRNLIVAARVGYRSEQIRQDSYRRGWVVSAGIERRF